MKGDNTITTKLQGLLEAELKARVVFFLQSRMCHNWGYNKLAAKLLEEANEETGHSQKLIDRMLFLEDMPVMKQPEFDNPGMDVPEQFKFSLDLELEAVKEYRDAIELCLEKGDAVTRGILEAILTDEEGHAFWLESQLNIIATIGEDNYLPDWI